MAENNKYLEVQKEARNNVLNIQEELGSIKAFEKEMKEKELSNKNKNVMENSKISVVPIRSDVTSFKKYTSGSKSCNDTLDNRKLADEWKEKGNNFVKLKDYESAIKMYTKAIEKCSDAVYFSNRSQCYLNLENYEKCIEDATCAVKLDKNSSKAYYRRMIAYEKLNENIKALQNCQEWMSALPDDQIAKSSYDRIHNKLIEDAKIKEKEKIKWSRLVDSANFIDKPLHTQSKKSLRKVNVCVKKSYSPIPDNVIDKIFNNNTGEHTPEFDMDSKLFKPNFLEKSYVKPKPILIDDKNVVNETNEILKSCDKRDKILTLEELEQMKNDLITLPITGPQFFAAWKELSEELRFLYLKNIAENNLKVGKLLGAQLNSDMLVQIINILHKFFLPFNLSYINFIYELSKNSELSVLAMFLEDEEKERLKELLNVSQADNNISNMIQQIKQNFQF